MPTFREVTDQLGLTAPELAAILGRPAQSIYQMRLDPSNPGYRPPPDGWRATLAALARQRGGELTSLAEELEKGTE